MNFRTAKIIIVGAIVLGSPMASLMIQRNTQAKLRQTEEMLRQQTHELAELAAEHQRLSNRLAEARSEPVENRMAELAKLRSEAGALRKRTKEIAKQMTENRQSGTARVCR